MFLSNNSFEILQHDGGTIGRKKKHLSPPNIFHFGEKKSLAPIYAKFYLMTGSKDFLKTCSLMGCIDKSNI